MKAAAVALPDPSKSRRAESSYHAAAMPLPGRFQISINGQLIGMRFGTLGEALDAAPAPSPAHLVEILDGWTRKIVRRARD